MSTPTQHPRYGLLCRALQASPSADSPQPAYDHLRQLEAMLQHDLPQLARQGSPDDFPDIYLGLTHELARLREFCADPRLAQKTIVAFGGPFSAGKSSLINALIGTPLLVVEVEPSTALPAYVLGGSADGIHALNLHRLRVPLSPDELASLTHDELQQHGSQVAQALSAAFVTRRDFPWAHLAFVDTPGYSAASTPGQRSDAERAHAHLAGAHALVWVQSIKQGNLSAQDLDFLAQLAPVCVPLVVLTHADLLPEPEQQAVLERVRSTLHERNLPTLGVVACSTRARHAHTLQPLRAQLDLWEQGGARTQRFAQRCQALFVRYQRGLEREADTLRWQLQRVHRIATLAEGAAEQDAHELKTLLDARLATLKGLVQSLHALRLRFLATLRQAGAAVGIDLPAPHELEQGESGRSNLLEQIAKVLAILAQKSASESGRSNLLEQLVALLTQAQRPAPEPPLLALMPLRTPASVQHHALLQGQPTRPQLHTALAGLRTSAQVQHHALLQRRQRRSPQHLLATLT